MEPFIKKKLIIVWLFMILEIIVTGAITAMQSPLFDCFDNTMPEFIRILALGNGMKMGAAISKPGFIFPIYVTSCIVVGIIIYLIMTIVCVKGSWKTSKASLGLLIAQLASSGLLGAFCMVTSSCSLFYPVSQRAYVMTLEFILSCCATPFSMVSSITFVVLCIQLMIRRSKMAKDEPVNVEYKV